MKKAFLISGIFISTLIGAGFASGNEILFYFSSYSKYGIISVFLAVFLFCFLEYMIISQTQNKKDCTFSQYLEMITGKKMAGVLSVFSNLFMIIVFSCMISGFSEMCFELYEIKKFYGALFMLILSFFAVCKGYDGFVRVQAFLSFLIIVSIIFAVFYMIVFFEKEVQVFSVYDNFLTSGVSFVGYNMLSLSAVMCIMGYGNTKKSAVLSAVLSGVFLLLIMISMFYILSVYSGMIPLGEIPLLTISRRYGKVFSYFYSGVIFIAMLTTAISNCYVPCEYFKKFVGNRLSLIFVLVGGFFLSSFDFSFIVDKLYRISGILSVYLIYCIIKYNIKTNKKC